MGLSVTLREPGACSPTELTMFRDLVVQGDEVDPNGLECRIQKARALVFGNYDSMLMAVGAVKCQEPNYRRAIFQKAGISELSDRYLYELGWIFVAPNFRGKGVSIVLVEKSLALFRAENIYSTSKTTNARMHHTLLKVGFFAAGNSWRSKRGPYDLAMYLRPAAQPSAAADAPPAARR